MDPYAPPPPNPMTAFIPYNYKSQLGTIVSIATTATTITTTTTTTTQAFIPTDPGRTEPVKEAAMEVMLAKIISLLILTVLTVLCGLLPLRLLIHNPRVFSRNKQPLDYLLCCLRLFSGGIYLATCFLHLLPDTREKMAAVMHNMGTGTHYAVPELLVISGFYAVVFVEQIIQELYAKAQSSDCNRRRKRNPPRRMGDNSNPIFRSTLDDDIIYLQETHNPTEINSYYRRDDDDGDGDDNDDDDDLDDDDNVLIEDEDDLSIMDETDSDGQSQCSVTDVKQQINNNNKNNNNNNNHNQKASTESETLERPSPRSCLNPTVPNNSSSDVVPNHNPSLTTVLAARNALKAVSKDARPIATTASNSGLFSSSFSSQPPSTSSAFVEPSSRNSAIKTSDSSPASFLQSNCVPHNAHNERFQHMNTHQQPMTRTDSHDSQLRDCFPRSSSQHQDKLFGFPHQNNLQNHSQSHEDPTPRLQANHLQQHHHHSIPFTEQTESSSQRMQYPRINENSTDGSSNQEPTVTCRVSVCMENPDRTDDSYSRERDVDSGFCSSRHDAYAAHDLDPRRIHGSGELSMDQISECACALQESEVQQVVEELTRPDLSSRAHFRSIIYIMALSFHGIFEGMALGLQAMRSSVWSLCFAIVVHRCVLAFKLGMDLCRGDEKQGTSFLCIGTFTLISTLGIIMGILISSGASLYSNVSVPEAILQCLATGTILYIVFLDILFKDLHGHEDLKRVSCSFVGFAMMAIVFAVTRS